jgi:hypothetical protein
MTDIDPGSDAQGHRHVLSVCVLRYYFELQNSDRIRFEEDGYTIEEARALGLKPLLAVRLAVDGISYAAIRIGRLEDGLPLGPLLQEIWEQGGEEFKGPPKELLVDSWLMDAVPELGESLAAVGCAPRVDIGRKKVSGAKGVLQRHRFYVEGALTVARINATEKSYERLRWGQLNQEAAGWRHTSSGQTRAWPDGVSFAQCVVQETSSLWDKLPVKVRPQRDPAGDAAIAEALQVLRGGSRFEHDERSLATVLRGTKLLADALKPGLDCWLAGMSWNKSAYLFAGTETGCGIARLRLGKPFDSWAKVMNREERLPTRWPHMNEGTCEIEGFGLEVQLWDLRDSVDLTVAVVVEGPGRWWIKDALKSKRTSEIERQVRRGKFKVEWEDLGKDQLKDAWDELTKTLSENDTVSALCLERRLQHPIRIDEVFNAMGDASALAETLIQCAVEVWREGEARTAGGGTGS